MPNAFTKIQIDESSVQLQNQITSFVTSDANTCQTFFNQFIHYCETDEVIVTITSPLKEIDVPFDEWWNRKGSGGGRIFELPIDSEKKYAFLYQLCYKIYVQENGFNLISVGLQYFKSKYVNENNHAFNRAVIQPLNLYFSQKLRNLNNSISDDAPQNQNASHVTNIYHAPVFIEGAKPINVTNSNFEGISNIGHDGNIVNPTNVKTTIYKTNKPDRRLYENISPYLMEKYGRKKLTISGFISILLSILPIISGFKSLLPSSNAFTVIIIDVFPTFPMSYGLWLILLGFVLFLAGIFLAQVPRFYDITICEKCKKEYAYEEVGTPKIEETKTRWGYNEVTTRYDKCRFCGHERERVSVEKFDKKGNKII
jgi:hypothetical protein